MPDRHAIANQALGLIGASRIVSFDQGTVESDLCRDLYEDAVREVLQDHPWNFAEDCESLAADAVSIRPDFLFSYQLPRPFCIPRYILTSDGRRTTRRYRISGNKLCTDEPSVRLVFTKRAAEQDFRPLFTSALAYLLAARLAGPITEVDSKVQNFLQLYQRTLAQARNRDSQEDSPEQFETGLLISVHHG